MAAIIMSSFPSQFSYPGIYFSLVQVGIVMQGHITAAHYCTYKFYWSWRLLSSIRYLGFNYGSRGRILSDVRFRPVGHHVRVGTWLACRSLPVLLPLRSLFRYLVRKEAVASPPTSHRERAWRTDFPYSLLRTFSLCRPTGRMPFMAFV